MMHASPPRVTIGMPVYNGAAFLELAIDSILKQSFQDFELIISDNASTDRTQEICQTALKTDRRIRYYRNDRNRGAAYNHNRLVELAQGVYFKWAAHDDLIAPDYLQRCVEILDRHAGVVLCYPQTVIMDVEGNATERLTEPFHIRSRRPHERFRDFLPHARGSMNPIAGLMRLSVLRSTRRIGGYPSSDTVLLGELVLHGEIYELPEPLFFRRKHAQNSAFAHPCGRALGLWFDPAYRGHGALTTWRWLGEYLKAIHRLPMSWRDKFLCYLQICHWVKAKRKPLARELKMRLGVRSKFRLDRNSC